MTTLALDRRGVGVKENNWDMWELPQAGALVQTPHRKMHGQCPGSLTVAKVPQKEELE